jgi:hypothetical protein
MFFLEKYDSLVVTRMIKTQGARFGKEDLNVRGKREVGPGSRRIGVTV